jgi:hypothetical protein
LIIVKKCVKLSSTAVCLRILLTRFLTESECPLLGEWCILGVTHPGRKDGSLLKDD